MSAWFSEKLPMLLYRLEIHTNVGKMTCEVAAQTQMQAFAKARKDLRREAPSVRVKGMKVLPK